LTERVPGPRGRGTRNFFVRRKSARRATSQRLSKLLSPRAFCRVAARAFGCCRAITQAAGGENGVSLWEHSSRLQRRSTLETWWSLLAFTAPAMPRTAPEPAKLHCSQVKAFHPANPVANRCSISCCGTRHICMTTKTFVSVNSVNEAFRIIATKTACC
jgi:hypothetical protein